MHTCNKQIILAAEAHRLQLGCRSLHECLSHCAHVQPCSEQQAFPWVQWVEGEGDESKWWGEAEEGKFGLIWQGHPCCWGGQLQSEPGRCQILTECFADLPGESPQDLCLEPQNLPSRRLVFLELKACVICSRTLILFVTIVWIMRVRSVTLSEKEKSLEEFWPCSPKPAVRRSLALFFCCPKQAKFVEKNVPHDYLSL